MSQWYVKDIAKLTGVSVQTLHHYDRIGLLKPSVRLPNGYRLYSEKDLLKLQQIIALKFFAFELSQIKTLLTGNVKALEHFAVQAQFLEKKAQTLLEASNTLKNIISNVKDGNRISWETIIKLIEVYRMTQELEKTWISKALTPEELKQYANFEANLKTKITATQRKELEQNWNNLINNIQSNLDQDPTSNFGYNIAKQVMDLLDNFYDKKHIDLRNAIWKKGYKAGKSTMAPEIIQWLDLAVDHYYEKRIDSILELSQINPTKSTELWTNLMDEMYGDNQKMRTNLFNKIIKNNRTKKSSKEWLYKLLKP